MKEPLISIIIPVYNRAELIVETLISIKAQSYSNFECIIVDDGSTDKTETIILDYIRDDSRFFFFKRPAEKPKGANSCRNYGFDKSSGDFLQWFDSDDLMLKDFLKLKLKAILSGNYDYVISKTEDFEHPDSSKSLGVNTAYYKFEKNEINHYNYVAQKINWLTPDFLIKRAVVQDVRFNEKLPSGQEYNFLCKITARTVNAVILKKVLTLRRIHENSVKGKLLQNRILFLHNRFVIDFENWQDLKNISTPKVINYLFLKSVANSLNTDIDFKRKNILILAEEIKKRNGLYVSLLYLSYQLVRRNFKKGHFLRKKFQKEWNKG